VRAALPASIPVIGNGDVKDVAAWERMRRATGCDAVMVGRGSMGNPWFFRSLAALARGEHDPGPPTIDERRAVWRRHAELTLTHAPEKMRVHELRKTLAWYSRGLWGGSQLRQRSFTTTDISALKDMTEEFFDLVGGLASETGALPRVTPASAVDKAIRRHGGRGGHDQLEPVASNAAAAVGTDEAAALAGGVRDVTADGISVPSLAS
jgi:Dihydrouridine synthase (Dus)